MRRRISTAGLLLLIFSACLAHAQVTITQQAGALVDFKQPAAPLLWIAVGPNSQIYVGGGANWKQFLPSGPYTAMAIAQDGKVASHAFTVGGANPNPPDPPNPPPDPTPAKISAALVLNPDKLQTQSPQQAAAWIDGGAAAYMAKAGYRWRQIVSDSLDESGKSPAAELFFLQAAAKSGKSYPVLVIGKSGSAEVLYAETCPDIDTRNKSLQRYGGPGEFPQLAAVDWSKVSVDIGDPANEVKDGKPKYAHFAEHGVRWGLRPAPPRELRHRFLLQAVDAFPDIPESQWATWAASHNPKGLNARKPVALDQNGYGACAGFAATNGVLFSESVSGQPQVELSALSVYARSSPWPADGGSTLEDNARIVEQEGIPEVSFSPAHFGPDKYTNPRTWPAGWKENAAKHRCQVIDLSGDTAERSFHNLVVALLRGFPAAIGVDWPGGHSIIAVGVVFTSGKVTGILIQNSWGADWNGDGTTVRSRANVTNGCATFGGPFCYVSPTFRSQVAKASPAAKSEAKPADRPAEPEHKMAL